MNAIQFLHVLVVTFLLCMKITSSSSDSESKDYNTTRCFERERSALLVLKQGVLSAARRHDLLQSWKNAEEDCCKWKGVGCDDSTGHVTRLNLSSLISPACTNSISFSNISYLLLDLPYLKYLDLSKNCLAGTLLSLNFSADLSLSFLDISHNHLFGALPDNWMQFQGLVFLNLGYNNFSGRIPTSIGYLASLQTLILRNNKLYGDLPVSIRNCRNLGFVDLGLNKLSGKVPSWIGEDLKHLYALILKSNRFYGGLPYEICHLSNLHFLDLSINRISGTIPTCFGNFTAMIHEETEPTDHGYAYASASITVVANDPSASIDAKDPSAIENTTTSSFSYSDNVLARWKGQEFEYGSNFAYLKMIDLSTNELIGDIPIEITRLLQLKGLNLSGNRFYGNVPMEIGQLKVLECLDLSTNNFSGEIPPSMSGLSFLAYLNLSNNNFWGRIPFGTQLQGFDISTYEGNTGLCGKPLKDSCPGDEPADHIRPSSGEIEVEEEDREYKRWLYISASLGFSTSFWGFIGSLVLNRRWRHAYFLFLYMLKERIYVAMAVRIARLQRKLDALG